MRETARRQGRRATDHEVGGTERCVLADEYLAGIHECVDDGFLVTRVNDEKRRGEIAQIDGLMRAMEERYALLAVLRNAMLMNSKFTGAEIAGADFTDAVLDLPQQKALCSRASGTNARTGVVTRDSLNCR